MISTSFLRTLNLKKYQDFAEENRNRLKVFYIRTVNKINKQARARRQLKKVQSRCQCTRNTHKTRNEKLLTQTSQRLTSQDKLQKMDQSFFNRAQQLRTSLSRDRKSIEAKQIMLDFSLVKQQCQSGLLKLDKQNNESRKLVSLSRGIKKLVKKQANNEFASLVVKNCR